MYTIIIIHDCICLFRPKIVVYIIFRLIACRCGSACLVADNVIHAHDFIKIVSSAAQIYSDNKRVVRFVSVRLRKYNYLLLYYYYVVYTLVIFVLSK